MGVMVSFLQDGIAHGADDDAGHTSENGLRYTHSSCVERLNNKNKTRRTRRARWSKGRQHQHHDMIAMAAARRSR